MRKLLYLIPLIMLTLLLSSCELDSRFIDDLKEKNEVMKMISKIKRMPPQERINELIKFNDMDKDANRLYKPVFIEFAKNDKDPLVRSAAILTLTYDEQRKEITLKAAKDKNKLVRGTAIQELGNPFYFNHGMETGTLIEAITDQEPYVAERAMAGIIHSIHYLYHSSSKSDMYTALLKALNDKVPVLEQYLKGDDINIRVLSAVLLSNLGLSPDGVVQALDEGITADNYRSEVLYDLKRTTIDWSSVVPNLISYIQSEQASVRMDELLKQLGAGPTTLDSIRDLAPDSYLYKFLKSKGASNIDLRPMDSEFMRQWWLRFQPEGFPPEEVFLSDYNDYQLKLNAITALGNAAPDPEINEVLQSTAIDPDPRVRASAYTAIGMLANKARENLPFVLEGLDDEDMYAQNQAIEATAKFGPETASVLVPHLISLLKDSSTDSYLIDTAIKAFPKIGPAGIDAVPVLLELLQDDKYEQYDYYITPALISIWSGLGTPPSEYKILLEHSLGIAKPIAIKALADYGTSAIPMLFTALALSNPDDMELITSELAALIPQAPETIGDVLPYLHDPNETVREAAVTLLSLLGPVAKDALPVLREVAENDESALIREKATDAIKAIQGT